MGLSIALIFTVVGASAFTSFSVSSTATILPGVRYLVIIVMENEPLSSVYNCSYAPNCAYITGLANNNSLAKNYYVTSCGSTADYLTLTGGSGFNMGCLSCPPLSCGSSIWPMPYQNVVDRVESSQRTWKAYMEDYPGSGTGANYSSGGCYLANSGKYAVDHNPFVYYTDIENSTSRCSRIVRANTNTTILGPEVDDLLLNDLQSPLTASNLIWLTPNLCDDMHDLCYGSTSVAEGNLYLSKLIPNILNSPVFETGQAALFLTWDEGNYFSTPTTQEIAAIWAGSVVKTQYCNCTTAQYYSHASFPKTMETIWNLPSLNQQDATAPAMMEFFS